MLENLAYRRAWVKGVDSVMNRYFLEEANLLSGVQEMR